MKIGILTFQRAHNPGALLQCYALWKVLSDLGHVVKIIDYRNDKIESSYDIDKLIKNRSFTIKSIIFKIFWIINYKVLKRKEQYFNSFIETLDLTKSCNKNDLYELNQLFDCFICGSDQVWSPNKKLHDTTYLLDFVDKEKLKIAYAASFGMNCIYDNQRSVYNDLLNKFNSISVREESAIKLVNKISNCDATSTLDPTLLLTSKEWNLISNDNKIEYNYILLYTVQEDYKIKQFAKKLSLKTGLRIVKINNNPRDIFYSCEKKYDFDPITFICLIKNASYICSDSYHGTIFSIIYKKQFLTSINNTLDPDKSVNSRIIDLLTKLGLKSQVFHEDTELNNIEKKICFDECEKVLQTERLSSIQFIKDSLNKRGL